jgi:hypothetical protein
MIYSNATLTKKTVILKVALDKGTAGVPCIIFLRLPLNSSFTRPVTALTTENPCLRFKAGERDRLM